VASFNLDVEFLCFGLCAMEKCFALPLTLLHNFVPAAFYIYPLERNWLDSSRQWKKHVYIFFQPSIPLNPWLLEYNIYCFTTL